MADELIRGGLRDQETGGPVAGLQVEAWDTVQLFFEPLGTAESNADGVFSIPLTDDLLKRLVSRQGQVFFRVLRDGVMVTDTRDTVQWDPREPRRVIIPVPTGQVDHEEPDTPRDPFDVHGTVGTDRGTHAAGLRVEIWDQQLRGEQLLEAGVTDTDGQYRITYDPTQLTGKQLADVQVRVLTSGVDDSGRQDEVARSKVTYQASRSLQVDVIVPFDALPRSTEQDRLAGALQPLLGDTSLPELGPDSVVYLANRSGFDPRAVAMALQASRASAETGIPAEHYYALFRVGAASDVMSAHRLTDARIESAIESAIKAGVISDTQSIDATLEIHRAQASKAFRSFVPPGGMSTLDDLLSLRLDDAGKDVFIDRLRATKDKPEQLWDALAESGMDPQVIAQLQTDGKLGHLTLQNASLMRRLVEDERVETTTDLVKNGLYDPDAWMPLIAGRVPPGLTADEYAAGLAAQVRYSFPTLVTADLVRREQVVLGLRERRARRSQTSWSRPTASIASARRRSAPGPASTPSTPTRNAARSSSSVCIRSARRTARCRHSRDSSSTRRIASPATPSRNSSRRSELSSPRRARPSSCTARRNRCTARC